MSKMYFLTLLCKDHPPEANDGEHVVSALFNRPLDETQEWTLSLVSVICIFRNPDQLQVALQHETIQITSNLVSHVETFASGHRSIKPAPLLTFVVSKAENEESKELQFFPPAADILVTNHGTDSADFRLEAVSGKCKISNRDNIPYPLQSALCNALTA